MTMTATYDPNDNKLRLRSVGKLDRDLYDRVRAAGFIWAPRQELFVAPKWTPEREDLLMELCEEIGDEDTSLVDRAAERAERFGEYEEHRKADAQSANAAVEQISSGIPLGQPILVGHHSEKRARKDAERIENGVRKAIKMWEKASYWKQRAAGAIRHAKYKERADVRARRIKTLESDLRREEKRLKEANVYLALWHRADLDFTKAKAIANGMGYVAQKFPLAEYPRALPASQYEGDMSVWSALDDGIIGAEQARDICIPRFEKVAASAQRWINHLILRLSYENAMLQESGYTPPPKPKTKASLPILNYSGTVEYRDSHAFRGEFKVVKTEAVGITKAQLADVHADYKGTRLSACGTHRLRSVMANALRGVPGVASGYGMVMVYLTDAKQHPRPTPEAVATQAASDEAAKQNALAELDRRARKMMDSEGAAAKDMSDQFRESADRLRQVLKTGIKAVAVPQLFPTPKELAKTMVAKLGLVSGKRILEPSAGTGNLITAAVNSATGFDCVQVVAVEINRDLADSLEEMRRRWLYANEINFAIHRGDFMEMVSTDLGGKFDGVVMNPPFVDGQDVAHIQHAFAMLKPGGRLVAICANGSKQNKALKPFVEERGGTWEELPPDTFKEQGTGVRTVLLTISRSPDQ